MLAESELEPLVLADGTRIDPTTGKAVKDRKAQRFVEVPSGAAAQELVVRTRKSVAELPLPPTQLGGVALVAFYTLFGLPDAEISVACDAQLTVPQIKKIRELDAYKEFMQQAKTNIMETETNQVRDIVQKHAVEAVNTIVEAMDEGGVLGFKAAQDILDRAGHRPADIVEHRHSMENALQIVVTRKDTTVDAPLIDITPRIVND
jgi:hypothetical protein